MCIVSSCRFITVLSKKGQMTSWWICKRCWALGADTFERGDLECISGIHTLKCLQSIYFLSSRCPTPAMPQWDWALAPNIPTLPGHGFLLLAQSWPVPIPMAEPGIWRCSSAPQLHCSWLDGWIQFEPPQLQHPGSPPALQSQNLPQILLSKLSFISCHINSEDSQHL